MLGAVVEIVSSIPTVGRCYEIMFYRYRSREFDILQHLPALHIYIYIYMTCTALAYTYISAIRTIFLGCLNSAVGRGGG